MGLDVTFPELPAESLQGFHLLYIEEAVGRGLLQPHQPVILAKQNVAATPRSVTI